MQLRSLHFKFEVFLHPSITYNAHAIAIFGVYTFIFQNECNAKVVGKNMTTKRYKAYIPMQKLSAKIKVDTQQE